MEGKKTFKQSELLFFALLKVEGPAGKCRQAVKISPSNDQQKKGWFFAG